MKIFHNSEDLQTGQVEKRMSIISLYFPHSQYLLRKGNIQYRLYILTHIYYELSSSMTSSNELYLVFFLITESEKVWYSNILYMSYIRTKSNK